MSHTITQSISKDSGKDSKEDSKYDHSNKIPQDSSISPASPDGVEEAEGAGAALSSRSLHGSLISKDDTKIRCGYMLERYVF